MSKTPWKFSSISPCRCEDPGAKILIFIGRWVKQKGVDHIAMLTQETQRGSPGGWRGFRGGVSRKTPKMSKDVVWMLRFWNLFLVDLQSESSKCHGSRVEREPPGTTEKYCVFDEGRKDICIYIYTDVVIHKSADLARKRSNRFSWKQTVLPLIEDTSHSTFLVPHRYGPPHSGARREDSSHSYKWY